MRHRRLRPVAVLAVLVGGALAAPAGAPVSRAGGTCRGEPVTILGSDGDDHLTGTQGPDVIGGLGGDDTIDGLGGDDIICGDSGDDALHGGPGSDHCDGGGGTDSAPGCERSANVP